MTRPVLYGPLRWPTSWPRVPEYQRKSATFSGDRSLTQAVRELHEQVSKITSVVPSSILITVADGNAKPGRNTDPGAAVYFNTLRSGAIALACDRWDYAPHNAWAIAKHVEAIRGQERWGVGTAEQAWAGFAALPPSPDATPCPSCGLSRGVDPCPHCGWTAHPPPIPISWRRVLGFAPTAKPDRAAIERAFRERVHAAHPDTGGSHSEMAALNNARDEALEEL